MKITQRIGKAAFTLIELMAVITIIVILAGLVIGGMGFVTERQAKEKARVQIALLSKAIEEYKLDMGTYPPTADKSTASAPNGTGTSSILFNYLYWDSDNDAAGVGSDDDQKIYLSDLDPVTSKQGWTTKPVGSSTVIVDPWGNTAIARPRVFPMTPLELQLQIPPLKTLTSIFGRWARTEKPSLQRRRTPPTATTSRTSDSSKERQWPIVVPSSALTVLEWFFNDRHLAGCVSLHYWRS